MLFRSRVASLLMDASWLDRSVYALKTTVTDFTETLRLHSAAEASPDWEHADFILANSVRVLSQTIDWDGWNGWKDGWPTALLASKPMLVQRVQDSVRIRRISPLALVVLTALQRPQTCRNLVEVLIADGCANPQRELADRVQEQVRRAYLAGIVTIADAVSLTQ